METYKYSPSKYRIRKIVPVVTKKDPICPNNILLSNKHPNTFGRILSDEVNYRLLSKVTPLMISRKHATIACEGEKVMIADHNSINGVYIEGRRIKPGERHQVKIGEKIAFGCGMGGLPSEFEYILERIPFEFRNDWETSTSTDDFECSPMKRVKLVDSASLTIIESNAAQIKNQEDKIKKLTEKLLERENKQAELNNQLKQTEKGLVEKLEQQKIELESERFKAEAHLQKLLESQLKEKEDLLRIEFDKQIDLIKNEKNIIEKNLNEELNSKLHEKDEAYKQQLEQQKEQLQQAMLEKESERNLLICQLRAKDGLIEKYKCVEENQKQLEFCLEELRRQIDEKENQLLKQKEVSKQVETEAKQNVIQTMEDEFTCIICQELFVGATTLSCAHTFCEVCLLLWSKKKKSCPVCRRRIKGKAVRSLVLDSAVEKMIESMEEDAIKRHAELKQEREDMKRRDIALEGPGGLRSLIHLADDHDNETEEFISRNARVASVRNRQRSRSRSPRNYRHRPYDNRDQRQVNVNIGYGNNQYGRSQVYGQQRFPPNNNRGSNSNYYYPQQQHGYNNIPVNYQVFNNNIRCFYCGAAGHLDRFCPRR